MKKENMYEEMRNGVGREVESNDDEEEEYGTDKFTDKCQILEDTLDRIN